ncbi:MAG: hypothetical protein GTN74_12730 [Proteobacteria bacterium]|nr:hypothetical protein [Pseudomonadota bacterium]NIS71218.1 hypothetical protein [Pseudomonadota bacterium]
MAIEEREVYPSEPANRELKDTLLELSTKPSKEQMIFIRGRIRQLAAMATCVPVSASMALSRDAEEVIIQGMIPRSASRKYLEYLKSMLS